MAFGCRIWLKSECDGCGMCDEPMHTHERVPFDDDYGSYEPDDYREE